MADDFWFKPKTRGYGAVPSNWKGLALTLGFLLAVLGGSILISLNASPARIGRTTVWALAYALTLTGLFVWVCRKKCSGPWCWR